MAGRAFGYHSLVQILSYKLANNYELKHRDAKAKLTVTQDYLDRQHMQWKTEKI